MQLRLELAPSPSTLWFGLLFISLIQVGPYTVEFSFSPSLLASLLCPPPVKVPFAVPMPMPVAVVMTLTPRIASSLLAHCLMIKAKWKQRWWRQQRLHQQLLSSEVFLPIRKRLLWKPDFSFLTYFNPSLINSDYNWMSFVSRDNFLTHFYNQLFGTN